MAITIYNKTELQSLAVGRFPIGVNAGSSAQDLLDQLADERNSADLYAGVISGGGDTVSVTTTPQLLATFDTNATSANELFSPDHTNDCINQLVPALVNFVLSLQGQWSANDDLYIDMKINDVLYAPFTRVQQSGAGPSRTVDMYKERVVPVGENSPFNLTFPAKIELWVSGSSSFTLTQLNITFGPKYEAYTIRTI